MLTLALPLALVAHVSAQVRGLGSTKTCPPTVTGGSTFQCTFTMQNLDAANSVTGLTVSNRIPDPISILGNECTGETTGTTPVPCLQPPNTGVPVTVLGPAGSPTDTCGNTINETAPPCSGAGNCNMTDRVTGVGDDTGVSVSANTGGFVV